VINNNNDQHQLQNDLQQLEIWEKKCQMQFNEGSHTELAYSIDGRTKVVYAAAFTSFGQECILRLRKPMVRLAFADMLLMWLFQLKSELNVTPRYFPSLGELQDLYITTFMIENLE
jgi:hypothetical protein